MKKSPPTPPATVDSIQQMATRIQRHQQRLYIVGLVVLIGTLGGLIFFNRYQQQQNDIAQNEMFQAVYYFEEEAFDKALHGDGICAGFLDIVQEYRFTRAANLAHFYAGVSYMHQKDYAKALHHLAKFKAKDLLLQARAWALMGDAHTEKEDYPSAVKYYLKAAAFKANKIFTPIYLAKAALAYEANKNDKAALDCYQRIVQDFPDATQYGEACKHVARLKVINKKCQESPSL